MSKAPIPITETSPLTKKIAARMRGELAAKKIDALELANSVGVSKSTMSRVLSGNRQIELDLLDKMCWALGLDLRTVVREADEAAEARILDESWTAQVLDSNE